MKKQNSRSSLSKKAKSSIKMFGKEQFLTSDVWKSNILNTNVWKSQNPQFQTLEETISRIPKFENAKIKNFTD